jgi:hypothetical protein
VLRPAPALERDRLGSKPGRGSGCRHFERGRDVETRPGDRLAARGRGSLPLAGQPRLEGDAMPSAMMFRPERSSRSATYLAFLHAIPRSGHPTALGDVPASRSKTLKAARCPRRARSRRTARFLARRSGVTAPRQLSLSPAYRASRRTTLAETARRRVGERPPRPERARAYRPPISRPSARDAAHARAPSERQRRRHPGRDDLVTFASRWRRIPAHQPRLGRDRRDRRAKFAGWATW